ncbi:MFS transporter [Kitasatospora aureofaciens]|uniref:hypothetical protein n=1 Tax=Kitasatospora aureofaciens TaxID=1894 RepID=UPI0036F454C1
MADDSRGAASEVTAPSSRGAVAALMFSQGVGVAGTQVTALALPTLAILLLDAGPLAASLVFALEYGIQGLTGPFAGVLVDRVASRRRLLIAVDVVQLLLVATVPLAHAVGALTLVQLCAVAAVSGALGGVTAIAVPTVVADFVPRDGLERQLGDPAATPAPARAVGEGARTVPLDRPTRGAGGGVAGRRTGRRGRYHRGAGGLRLDRPGRHPRGGRHPLPAGPARGRSGVKCQGAAGAGKFGG